MPEVRVLEEYCKSCELCIKFCPRGVLAVGNRPNDRGYFPVVVTYPEKCNGCAICGLVCPDVALEIYK